MAKQNFYIDLDLNANRLLNADKQDMALFQDERFVQKYAGHYTDFEGGVAGSPYSATTANAGSAIASGAAGRPGLVALNTNTNANGAVAVVTALAYPFGAGSITWEGEVSLSALADGTNTFVAHVGLFDSTGTASTTDAFFFRHSTANSGNWSILVLSGGSVTSNIDTGIPVVPSTYYRLKIVISAAATQIDFYINGSLIASVTTGLPTRSIMYAAGCRIVKSVGTSNRQMRIDWARLFYVFTSNRF